MAAEPGPTIDTRESLAGIPSVIMENQVLRAVLLPSLGGKLISLVDKRTDSDLLWRNSRIPLQEPEFGSDYDDQFVGGWDEIFPNDIPEVLAGNALPDHGELWSVPWAYAAGAGTGAVSTELRIVGPVTGVEAVKTLTLGTDARLVVGYRLHNPTPRPLPFLWKAHVALALDPDTMIDLPSGPILIEDFGSPRARPIGNTFDWPGFDRDGVRHDFRRLPDSPSGPVSEFLLATSPADGACGVRHPSRGTGLRLSWDLDALPSCWLFASYGGWRGLEVLVLEPCTGYPVSVVEGVDQQTHKVLDPGATLTWTITAELDGRAWVAEWDNGTAGRR
ncbi:hypothetical protein GCM10011575_34560 [Microlunatus endophyticus]|uniref:Galactose mutarotase n=1 Tax=Microlunatus endophyticus TaxID=1716077 RepID=A0A917W7N0_9ACTN|nr:DUF5107 domain-containing protein [Microlunatus endophyticus]GGL73297.1 hypothetical protein GCM10011575_34560 [Microlunatus endophyticus]